MLDIGWTELLVIAIVLIVVVGPKDLPPMLRAFGKMTANLRKMAGDFRTQFDEALRESELDDVRKTISDAQRLNPTHALRDAINPLRQMGQEIRSDLEKATKATPSTASEAKAEAVDVEAQQAVEGASAEQSSASPVGSSRPGSSNMETSSAASAAGGEAPKSSLPEMKPPSVVAPAAKEGVKPRSRASTVRKAKAPEVLEAADKPRRSRKADTGGSSSVAEVAKAPVRRRVAKKAPTPGGET